MNKKITLSAVAVVAIAGAFGLSAASRAATTAQAVFVPEAFVQVAQAAVTQAQLMAEGGPLFQRNCSPCHGANGQGGEGPKLVGNPFISKSSNIITQIFRGNEEHGMPPFADLLNDREIAGIATFARNSWGNAFGIVTPEEVKGTR